MKIYICKNHDDDGDLHYSVFTTEEKAKEFCSQNQYFNFDAVEITDDVKQESINYTERG